MINDHDIVKCSGQYDKEIIQRLKLNELGISIISNLDNCVNLIKLSLSKNAITSLCGLESLYNLKYLDVSHNKIMQLDSLDALQSLEELDIRANSIANIKELDKLINSPQLTHLFLQDADGENSNPVCKASGYITAVSKALPGLEILDGTHMQVLKLFRDVESQLADMAADAEEDEEPILDPWFSTEDTNVDEDPFNIPDSEPTKTNPSSKASKNGDKKTSSKSSSAPTSSAASITACNESYQAVLDILETESAHLIRKTQTSL